MQKNSPSVLDKNNDLKILGKLFIYLWPKEKFSLRLRIVLAMLCLILSKVINVYVPILLKKSIDDLSGVHIALTFASAPILVILAYGIARSLAQIFNELKDALAARVEHQAMRDIALKVFNHLHKLSLRFHLNRKTGGLSRVIERGLRAMETVLRFMLFNILPIFVEMTFVSIVLWRLYNISYMLVTLGTLIIYIVATIKLTQWRINYVRCMQNADTDSNSKAVDSLLNYETVKYFGNEAHETTRYDVGLRGYQEAAIRSKYSLSGLNITQGLIIALGLVSLMIMAAFDVANGIMGIGDFVLVNTFLIQLYLPLNILGFAYREIKLAAVNMEDMFSLLDEKQEVEDPQTPLDFKPAGGHITFKDVHFFYNPDREILKGISFDVPAGTTTAIVGSSGAGKSTISRLLFRFYDATTGTITIDGFSLKDIRQEDLRKAIGIVPQDTVLFNDSIFYNICYGRPSATKEDVYKAAKMANIHDFIMSLPQGYDTMVGERGLKLSGGEKQRVAIARTFLKHPLIFIFDEATSALDTQTEKGIQSALAKLSKDHTTVIIAHRLSTVVNADQILVLDAGKIAEKGTHRELLAKGGLYAGMWEKQHHKSDDDAQES